MMDYRSQRQYDRAQRRAYRRRARSYGYYGGISGTVWLVVIILMVVSHWYWIWWLAFFALPFFFFVLRPRLSGVNSCQNQRTYQGQAYQQYQPPQQEQPPVYEQYQAPQQEQPVYQSYTQGYAAQPHVSRPAETYQEGEQQQQYQEQQQQVQQYEDPLTMYPQE